MTYRLLLAVASALVIVFSWWLFGYNFDHRSPEVMFGFLLSVAVWMLTITAPFPKLDKKV